jgi:hypothetical protein
MGRDKEPLSKRSRLLAFSGVPEIEVERPHPANSAMRALSSSVHVLMSERDELRETVIALEERLAISESLVGELKKELAKRDGRPSREVAP